MNDLEKRIRRLERRKQLGSLTDPIADELKRRSIEQLTRITSRMVSTGLPVTEAEKARALELAKHIKGEKHNVTIVKQELLRLREEIKKNKRRR